jgi:hypothetical protein
MPQFPWSKLCRQLAIVYSVNCLLGPLQPACLAADPAEAVDLGSRRELFVDGYLVAKLAGTQLQLHEPRPGGIAIRYDGPADYPFSFYSTILKDGDVYRMYYRGGSRGGDWKKSVTCYAESRDGITWTRPKLGIVEVDGSRDNNAILPVGDQFCPFIDGRPRVSEEERYKANMLGGGGLQGFVSGDGIHWKLLRAESFVPSTLPNNFDSQNPMFWSDVENCYVLYARHMAGGRRATARATSTDFLTWTEQVPMTYSDTGTTVPSQHLYTNQTQPYFRAPQIYISLPGRFQAGRRVLTDAQAKSLDVHTGGGGVNDISDGVFLTSRAGSTRYDFTFRESFVRPGIGISNWVSRTNYPALGVVPTSSREMSLYVQRDYGQPTARLERRILRTDGFVSVHAPYDVGEMITKPFKFIGRELELNYATSAAGGIGVELQDENGKPIEGFTLSDCTEIIGDEIERVVSWKRGSDVAPLVGRPVRLRFAMHDADLYSLRFRP